MEPPMDEAVIRWLMKPSNEDLTTVDDLFGRPSWHPLGGARQYSKVAMVNTGLW
jgi:hypothetical protein